MLYERDFFYKDGELGVGFYTAYVYIEKENEEYCVYVANESHIGSFEVLFGKFKDLDEAKKYADKLECKRFWINL